jgi:hypothetical protein
MLFYVLCPSVWSFAKMIIQVTKKGCLERQPQCINEKKRDQAEKLGDLILSINISEPE